MYDVLAAPFGSLLSLLFDLTHNYLFSLIFITVVIRLLLLPQAIKQQKNSAKQMRLQAKVNKIRAKYSTLNPREAQMKISEETQELYRREGFSMNNMGCLPMILQLGVMMGLYGAIYSPIKYILKFSQEQLDALTKIYQNLSNVSDNARQAQLNILGRLDEMKAAIETSELFTEQNILDLYELKNNFKIFGLDLTVIPKDVLSTDTIFILIPVLAGVTALLTSLFMYIKQKKTNPEMAKNPMMGCMTFMSPAMSFGFSFSMSAGVGFYWIISNILSFIQTVGIAIAFKPEDSIASQMIDETVQRRSREQNIKLKAQLMKKQNEKTE